MRVLRIASLTLGVAVCTLLPSVQPAGAVSCPAGGVESQNGLATARSSVGLEPAGGAAWLQLVENSNKNVTGPGAFPNPNC